MRGPCGTRYICWAAIERGMGEQGENNRFQRCIGIAIMLWRHDGYRVDALPKELHQQRIVGAAATHNNFIDRPIWKNKLFVVEGNGLNGKRRAGASDIRWAQFEIGARSRMRCHISLPKVSRPVAFGGAWVRNGCWSNSANRPACVCP